MNGSPPGSTLRSIEKLDVLLVGHYSFPPLNSIGIGVWHTKEYGSALFARGAKGVA